MLDDEKLTLKGIYRGKHKRRGKKDTFYPHKLISKAGNFMILR